MENEQLSDLARAVLGYERITASTDVSKGAISSINTAYQARKNHKLDCWRDFCKWVETLPYFKEIYLED